MDQGDAEQVRTLLRNAGIFVGMLNELTTKVSSMPDGLDRLRTTYERIRNTTRSPAAVLASVIRAGQLDDLSERERYRRESERAATETAQGSGNAYETLEQAVDRIWSEHRESWHSFPLSLQRLVLARSGNTEAEYVNEWQKVKAKPDYNRMTYIQNLERRLPQRPMRDGLAGMDERDPDERDDETFSTADAMRQSLQTAGN